MKRLRMICTVISLLLLIPVMASAGGWNLAGVGAKSLAMSGAFRAIADDYSAMYWNPAGLAGQGTGAFLETKVLIPMTKVTPNSPSLVPGNDAYYWYQNGVERSTVRAYYPAGSASFIYQVDEDLSFGLSVFAPSALGTEWENLTLGPYQGYNESPEYPSKDWSSDMKVIDIHPTVGYRINDQWRVGLGISIDHATIQMQTPKVVNSDDGTGNPLPMPNQHFFVNTDLEGDGWGFGFNIGVLYDFNDQLHFGASFRGPVTIGLSGTVTQQLYYPAYVRAATGSDVGIMEVKPDADADFPLPMDFGIGAAYDVNDRLTLAADVMWTNWATADKVDIKLTGTGLDGQPAEDSELILNYENTLRFNFGFNFVVDPEKNFEIRGGYYHDPTPIPDETVRPTITDIADKNNLSLGFAIDLGEKMILEGYYEHLFSGTNEVKVADVDGDGFYDNVPGDWKVNVDTIGFSLGYRF